MEKNTYVAHKSIGDRIVACIVDYIVIWSFFIFFIYMFGEPNDEGGYHISGAPGLVPILFWGFATIGMEQLFGASLGNLLVGIKPISIDATTSNHLMQEDLTKISFKQSLLRHIVDPIDMCFFGLIGIIILKNTNPRQRLGDILAKTIVVKA